MLRSIVINKSLTKIIIVSIFIGIIISVYWRVTTFEFLYYDDQKYITSSAREISADSIFWAFTTRVAANWHPLTSLSLMFDHNLHGLNAGGYHLTNLLFHIANTLLLLYLLNKMTGAFYYSAFVAALFALHPLHVESVAWVSERKDVLSTFFMLLTMWAYVSYVNQSNKLKYFLVLLLFILGLMAKPMIVTLPFILLLMDYWPLGRMDFGQETPSPNNLSEKKTFPQLIGEKIPLFLCSIFSAVITLIAQHESSAIASLQHFSFENRISNALISYSSYLGKTFWFQSLNPFYLYPKSFNYWQVGCSFLLICLITVFVIIYIKKKPYWAVGWFWYLGVLVPVIGLVQVGSQAMADRYTYIPLIGIFIGLSWGVPDLLSKISYSKIITLLMALFFLILIIVATSFQVKVWKNNRTLSEYALKLNPQNYIAYDMLGCAMGEENNFKEAFYNFYMAIHINPKFDQAYIDAGNLLMKNNRLDEAINNYKKALEINNNSAEAHYNLGRTLILKNNLNEAVLHLNMVLKISPDDADAHNNLGVALMKIGKYDDGLKHIQRAICLNPESSEFKKNMSIALTMLKSNNQQY
jgi:Flp pilus assembly protein TadD, contains TPR repeats